MPKAATGFPPACPLELAEQPAVGNVEVVGQRLTWPHPQLFRGGRRLDGVDVLDREDLDGAP
eukprot:15436674-Alexandrium_andersonii.AAC.1